MNARRLIASSKSVWKLDTGARLLPALFAASVALMPLTAAAQVAAPTAEQWAAVEAAAVKEGKVAVYHDFNPSGAEQIANAFRKDKPGIDVEMTRLASAALIERFSTEFAAGRNLADVVVPFPDERMFDGMKTGWIAAWIPPELKAFPPAVNYKNQNMLFNIQSTREVIIWNTQRSKAADAPKEWAICSTPNGKARWG